MKIGLLITARLKSTRLPLKAILPLRNKPVIDLVIDRAKRVEYIDQVVLCTSYHPQDKPLVDRAKVNEIDYFMGDPDDVLMRLYRAATFYGFDYIISITGDNPLFSTHYTHKMIDLIIREKPDYIKVLKLPLGMFTYGVSYSALKTVCEQKQIRDTEIWGEWFEKNQAFNVQNIVADERDQVDARLTLDTEEDYQMLMSLSELLTDDQWYSDRCIVQCLNNNKDLIRINEEVEQKSLSPDEKKRIRQHWKQ
ncbi:MULTISPECIES: cytidylyltransferase domain-containing protein [Bacillaceae]|uniref:3-deoxy-manno-octulosonate cytidylyltransferase n=1 Tax=Evansella alkalicola TaxID=745819 RepID=A0ABS6JY87_9BACI|nr:MULTISPECIES: 3-deoxy-manno-octulosonate cytidylyltransferase [Bacillaceae]MBU9723453.1 hypothetical protein [Bacillus alkalicola]